MRIKQIIEDYVTPVIISLATTAALYVGVNCVNYTFVSKDIEKLEQTISKEAAYGYAYNIVNNKERDFLDHAIYIGERLAALSQLEKLEAKGVNVEVGKKWASEHYNF